jgi:hypothetical protein
MDIEGAEITALHGAENTFANAKNIDFSICVYHNGVGNRTDDEIEIPAFLNKHGRKFEFSDGFLMYGWQLRRGVVRSIK